MAPLKQQKTADLAKRSTKGGNPMNQKPKQCDEENPVFCIDPDGEIPLRCGLPKGHDGPHQDERTVGAEPEKTESAP